LLNRDSELCNRVIADDEEVDILEKQVDQDGVNLLMRFHPVASDMREVIADHSVTIARRAKNLNTRPAVRDLPLLEPPYRLAVEIFRDSMRAYADGDCELGRTLKLKDRELDILTRELSEKLVERATVDSELVPTYVDLIFVARALERIGIMRQISLRIPSGATKPPTFGIPTVQKRKINLINRTDGDLHRADFSGGYYEG
jgi:phosphate transport system protein